MSRILSQNEKRENQRKAEVTYKIIALSIKKVENSLVLLRTFHKDNEIIVSPIMKNRGDSGFHCFVNVLPNPPNPKKKVELERDSEGLPLDEGVS